MRLMDSSDKEYSIIAESAIGKCCTNLIEFRGPWIDQKSFRKISVKVGKRRGCRVFRFSWPQEWDKPVGDKPKQAEDLPEAFLIVCLKGFSSPLNDIIRRKVTCKWDKQEQCVVWLISLWRKIREKFRRVVCQRSKGKMSGGREAVVNRMVEPSSEFENLPAIADLG